MDPISDMLTQIRNAQAVNKDTISIPFSDLKYNIAKILEKRGFVEKVEKHGKKPRKNIEIVLKYLPRSEISIPRGENDLESKEVPAISGLKRISKPGQRIYLPAQKIRKVRAGYGMAIISTSKGLMTDQEARKRKVGGEVICEIW